MLTAQNMNGWKFHTKIKTNIIRKTMRTINHKRLDEIKAELAEMGICLPNELVWSIRDVKEMAEQNDVDISNKTDDELFDILYEALSYDIIMEDMNDRIECELNKLP